MDEFKIRVYRFSPPTGSLKVRNLFTISNRGLTVLLKKSLINHFLKVNIFLKIFSFLYLVKIAKSLFLNFKRHPPAPCDVSFFMS